ncbi:MAG: hypothetical protein ACYDAO_10690 [Thermoplasmataceae archaeon]
MMPHKCFNSPYGVEEYGDVRVNNSAVPSRSREIRTPRNDLLICKWCFYGIHPHDARTKENEMGGFKDAQDCKVILVDEKGNTTGQCCCTWYKGD